MRSVKAKALRRALGFHPGKEREYQMDKPAQKVRIGTDGRPQVYAVSGTVTCKGVRGEYQKVKRTRVLTEAVLRAAIGRAHA